MDEPRTLRPRGGYRRLRSFQTATLIYDGTVAFCDRIIEKRSRTHDQMVQAARSGRQNIAEGSRASGTSAKSELRLVNVARASLDELLLDYEDFLRQRALPRWTKNDPQALAVRALGRKEAAAEEYAPWLKHREPAVAANTLICLIHQANYLLDRQIAALEKSFVQEGGYSEKLLAARLEERQRQRASAVNPTDPTDPTVPSDGAPTAPTCSLCSKPMVLRTARKGPRAGTSFWGCAAYPNCKGTRPNP
jgi:four helix bundle suffix protein